MAKNTTIKTLKWHRDLAVAGAALTSMTVVFNTVYGRMTELFSPTLSLIGAILITTGILAMIDFGLRQYLPYGLNLIFSSRWRKDIRAGAFVVILMSVCAVQLYTSMTISWVGRVDMVEAITPDLKTQSVVDVISAVDQSSNARIQEINRTIAKYEAKARADSAAIRKANPGHVAAVDSGKDKWGWHQKQLNKAYGMSKTLALANSKVLRLLEQKEAIMEQGASVSQMAVSENQQTNVQKAQIYESRNRRNSLFLGYFGVACSLCVLVYSVLIELSNSFEYEFEIHTTTDYGAAIKVPKFAGIAPKPVAPNYEPVSYGGIDPRSIDFLNSKITGLERKINAGTESTPSMTTDNDTSSTTTYNDTSSMTTDTDIQLVTTRADTSSMTTDNDTSSTTTYNDTSSMTADKKSRPKANNSDLRKLKDAARNAYKRGLASWPELKEKVERRGCEVLFTTDSDGKNKVTIKGGK